MSAISSDPKTAKHPFKLTPLNMWDVILVLLSFLAGIVITFLIYFGKALFNIQSISQLVGTDHETLEVLGEYFLAFLIIAVVYFVIRRHGLNWRRFGFIPQPFLKTVAVVILGFILTFVAWLLVAPLVLIFFPNVDLAQTQDIFSPNLRPVAKILLIFYAVIMGPFIEEIVFRGVILPAITRSWNLAAGIIISTLIWSLLHFQLNVIIFTFIFGIILSYQYYQTKSLWPNFLTHVLKNLIAVIAIYTMV